LPPSRQFAKDADLNLNAPTKVVDLLPNIIVRCLVVIEIPKLFDLFCDPLHTGELLWALLPIGLWNPEYCREQVAGVEVTFGEGVLLELGKREGHQHSNAFLLRQQEAQVFNLHRANGLPAKLVSRSNKPRGISGWPHGPGKVLGAVQGWIRRS
jgi:hypothetical protein